MTLHVGFTGTRHGMTEAQRAAVRAMLELAPGAVVHHGDCIGSDADVHAIARSLGLTVVGHPPTEERFRAFCAFDEVWPPMPFLLRNRYIVASSAVLIATPRENAEQPRGGTWHTVGVARRMGAPVPVRIVWPDGSVDR